MEEEIFELSLTPEYRQRIDDIIGIGGRSSLYGPEDPTAAMKQPNFDRNQPN